MNLHRPAMFSSLLWLATSGMPALAAGDSNDALVELSRMSLEQLAKVEVTSVSKAAQSLSTAPASIYVITREEIRRSGITRVPELLRLAPNLQITQLTATDYSNGARGLSGAPQAQNFSNKILVLIDGRSVYSPLFSGVVYDMQDVLVDDIERVEVISGPGATLWGANAMNGVINIITRRAEDSRGPLARADVGTRDKDFALRYGGGPSENAYRVYAKWSDRGSSELPDGTDAGDDWNLFQAGFRTDLDRGDDAFTLQGDYQQGAQNFLVTTDDVEFRGANLLGRWVHTGGRVDTRLQLYFDRVDREEPPQGIAFDIDTWDIELQQSAELAGRHQLVWGLGRRNYDYQTQNNALAFMPSHRDLRVTNIFVQDGISLAGGFKLTAGVKFEENIYSGWETLPDLRVSWAPNDTTLLWMAGSRAVRAPTPFDTDVQEFVDGTLFLQGAPQFQPEQVTAFELGIRGNPDARVSYSVSAFYDEYDDLRTIEITPVTLLPLRWGNLMEGSAYGVEAWANLQVAPWWRVSPGFRSVHKELHFEEGSSQLLGFAQAGNDPRSSWQLKSSMDFGDFTLDAMLRRIGELPEPQLDAYSELSARLAWRLNDQVEFAIKGFNLLNETHREYADPQGREIRRSVLAEIRYLR